MTKKTPRRNFIGATAAAGVLAGCEGCTSMHGFGSRAAAPKPAPSAVEPSGDPSNVADAPAPDLDLRLRAAPDRTAILEGSQTVVWRFSVDVLHGSEDAVVPHPAGYLGPTLKLKRGQRVRVHLENAIGEQTIVHWHGLHVAEQNDGHPSYAVASGKGYVYDFTVDNRAGTYWYHTHPDRRTGPQVYRGLAGLLLVSDDEEQRLGLPDGDRELPLVLQDRSFDADNQFVYDPNPMTGLLGDQLLVNGQIPETLEVARGPHRLRLLNGSNSRIYDLGWSDGSPITLLGTDGGLLEAPRERAHVVLAPGQRLDVWADFGGGLGQDVWLESKAFDDPTSGMGMGMGMGRGRGMGRGMMGGAMMGRGMGGGEVRVPNGAPLRIQRFVVTGQGAVSNAPDKLATKPVPTAAELKGPVASKTFSAEMGMMQWLLNGRTFEMRGVADNERVRLGTVEDWEFINQAGHMAMAHPIHLHGPQFQILERHSGPGARALHEGVFDEGFQDTFLLLPGDRVRIRPRFERHAGLFLYHCHNLEHEDMGMMRNFLVET